MLNDPREAHAEQNSFVHCLVGLSALAGVIRALAGGDDEGRTTPSAEADDFVHLLLALVSLGELVAGLAGPVGPHETSDDPSPLSLTPGELLR
jgi:hypothetical protein